MRRLKNPLPLIHYALRITQKEQAIHVASSLGLHLERSPDRSLPERACPDKRRTIQARTAAFRGDDRVRDHLPALRGRGSRPPIVLFPHGLLLRGRTAPSPVPLRAANHHP